MSTQTKTKPTPAQQRVEDLGNGGIATADRLLLRLDDATWLAHALLAGTSAEEATPIITGGQVHVVDGKLVGLSTDRYRVHRARLELHGGTFEPVVLPRPVLLWITRNASQFGKGHGAGLELTVQRIDETVPTPVGGRVETSRVTATIWEGLTGEDSVSLTTSLLRGNYPPVGRLVDEAMEAKTAAEDGLLNLDFIAKSRRLATDRFDRARLRSVESINRTGRSQLLVQFERGEALIQKAHS